MHNFILISLGAVLGANARYWITDWAAQKWGSEFAYGTLILNISGSLLLGLFITLASDKLFVDPRWRMFFAVGFLGAYTTFSTYTLESFNMMSAGNWHLGLFNLFRQFDHWLAGCGCGCAVGQSLVRLRRFIG